ncbi:MAG: patatin-like phospholipase family protein [Hyphomicrobiales bacterium]|nr:patatin-like phospholipase family protein [Hyphomicrobiales bacterium]
MNWDRIVRRATGLGGGGSTMNIETLGRQEAPSGKPRLGLALGGGAARGWAHIGVLKTLRKAGLEPDIIAGTSIGALVGGVYAAGRLQDLEDWARSLTKRRMVGLMDFHIGGSGLISGDRLKRLLGTELMDITIEDLPLTYAAIATELGTGHEIWLTHGLLVDAMRASYALPGVFDPVKLGGRWLMDGAMVNPIPVSAARAMGADVVICVNLNGDAGGRGTIIQSHRADLDQNHMTPDLEIRPTSSWLRSFSGAAQRVRSLVGRAQDENPAPGLVGVMIDAFNITQDRISRSRLAGDPPDSMISPRLGKIGLFDFHRAHETIEQGAIAAERALDDILAAIAACPVLK